MRKLSIELTSHFDLALEPKAEEHLLGVYRAVRNGDIEHPPEGFVNACAKLYDDASKSLILHTVVGEILSLIMKDKVPDFYPAPGHGMHFKPLRVSYQETPAKLDPPANAEPLLITVGNKTLH